jgi:hypothetical protein
LIQLLRNLLERGAQDGCVRADIDPLHLYVTLVSLAYFHKSNAYTLSWIFDTDLLNPTWQSQHKQQTQQMLLRFLVPPHPTGVAA